MLLPSKIQPAIPAEYSVHGLMFYILRIGKAVAWNEGGESRFSPLRTPIVQEVPLNILVINYLNLTL